MINKTALQHPTIQRKIKCAALRAFMKAGRHGHIHTEYVENRKGNNCIRIDYSPNMRVFWAWGNLQSNITHLITDIVGAN